MRAGKWIIVVIESVAGSVALLTAPSARAEDVAMLAPAVVAIRAVTNATPFPSLKLSSANITGAVSRPDVPAVALGAPELRDNVRKNPYAQASQSGLRLNINAGDKRPHLEYHFDANTSMRLRANRDGVRLLTSWNF